MRLLHSKSLKEKGAKKTKVYKNPFESEYAATIDVFTL